MKYFDFTKLFDFTGLSAPHRSIKAHLIAGMAAVFLLVAGIGGWAATTEFSGAVIAQGLLVVDTNVKKVQHPTGGVVGELRVHDGKRVQAGEILLRLDETQTRATLAVITSSLDELTARQARLQAERDGAEQVMFPEDLLAREGDPQIARLTTGERKLFETRRTTREGQRAQLTARIAQMQDEIRGNLAQEEAKVQQIEWITKELKGVRELWEKNLIPFVRVTTLEREAARLLGERGQALAAVAQIKGRIGEIELQILQIDQDMRSEVGRELSDIRGKISELSERKIAAEDNLKRIDIRSPQDGIVLQLAVHTVGGVIGPGEQIMLIVPEREALTIEAKVAPQEINQVHVGQPVLVRFSALNQRATPELNGTVSRVSADVTQDAKTGVYYYLIRAAVPETEVARLEDLRLIPGMPVEIFMQTDARTVLSYLVRPLRDQIMRSFRE
jgi:HlyD family secretion protein